MQGRIILGLLVAAAVPAASIAAEAPRRSTCSKGEQAQQPRASSATVQTQQIRRKEPECRTSRSVPSVVDPTPYFLL